MKEERWQIGEMARLAGVSVRTLRHYEDIGLLTPCAATPSGYRLYDGAALARLEQILYFRELGFALGEIRAIMTSPAYDAREAMRRQRTLLEMQKNRIDAMIRRLDAAVCGMDAPDMEVFDMSGIERARAQYAEETKARWGETEAYRQSEKRAAQYGKADWQRIESVMTERMQAFAGVRSLDPADARVQTLVEDWKAFITANFYPCTDEILAGLGQMYACDERFAGNIDRCGAGTADFMARAIAAYCASRRA